jgi:hypothetical protein
MATETKWLLHVILTGVILIIGVLFVIVNFQLSWSYAAGVVLGVLLGWGWLETREDPHDDD